MRRNEAAELSNAPLGIGCQVYNAAVERYEQAKDHVEYCLRVAHRSGTQWRVWQRFSNFSNAHTQLARDMGEARLPPLPKKSWWANFSQVIDSDFLDQRHRDLHFYLNALLARPDLAGHPAVQTLLGVQPPEPPAGVRVVPRRGEHELEIRPASGEAQHSPVDGYTIEITDADSGRSHSITRDVGTTGALVQRAQIGRLLGARYKFTVTAFNFAGASSPISIEVDTAQLRLALARTTSAEEPGGHPAENQDSAVSAAPREESPQQSTGPPHQAEQRPRPAGQGATSTWSPEQRDPVSRPMPNNAANQQMPSRIPSEQRNATEQQGSQSVGDSARLQQISARIANEQPRAAEQSAAQQRAAAEQYAAQHYDVALRRAVELRQVDQAASPEQRASVLHSALTDQLRLAQDGGLQGAEQRGRFNAQAAPRHAVEQRQRLSGDIQRDLHHGFQQHAVTRQRPAPFGEQRTASDQTLPRTAWAHGAQPSALQRPAQHVRHPAACPAVPSRAPAPVDNVAQPAVEARVRPLDPARIGVQRNPPAHRQVAHTIAGGAVGHHEAARHGNSNGLRQPAEAGYPVRGSGAAVPDSRQRGYFQQVTEVRGVTSNVQHLYASASAGSRSAEGHRLGAAATIQAASPALAASTAPAPGPADMVGTAAPAAGSKSPGGDDELDDEQICVVCLVSPKTNAFVPCGHRCVCAPCGASLLSGSGNRACPICRAPAVGTLAIYI